MKRGRRARAFSLLEVLLASLILAVALFAVVSLYPQAILGLQKARQMNNASNLAQKALEETKAIAFDDVRDSSKDELIEGTTYTVNLTTSLTDPRLKKLTVEVVWWFPQQTVATSNRRRLSVRYETCLLDLPDL